MTRIERFKRDRKRILRGFNLEQLENSQTLEDIKKILTKMDIAIWQKHAQ